MATNNFEAPLSRPSCGTSEPRFSGLFNFASKHVSDNPQSSMYISSPLIARRTPVRVARDTVEAQKMLCPIFTLFRSCIMCFSVYATRNTDPKFITDAGARKLSQ